MPHTLRASLGSFQLSYIRALVPVVHSLTMQFGSLLQSLRRLLTTLTFRPDYQIILLAQSYLHISSRKLQFQESVWSNSLSGLQCIEYSFINIFYAMTVQIAPHGRSHLMSGTLVDKMMYVRMYVL